MLAVKSLWKKPPTHNLLLHTHQLSGKDFEALEEDRATREKPLNARTRDGPRPGTPEKDFYDITANRTNLTNMSGIPDKEIPNP